MTIYYFGPFKLESESRNLSVGSTSLAAGSKVVETLLALVERAGQTCAAQQLLERIWPDGYVEPAILTQNIYVLRKLLHEHWDAPAIETVRRRGYRFVAPVSLSEPSRVARPLSDRLTLATPGKAWRRFTLAACLLVMLAMLPYSAGPVRGSASGPSMQSARLYAIGRYYWNSRTRAGVLKSIEYFQKIVRVEPRNALGYSGLADAYYILADYGYGARGETTYHAWERSNVDRAFALNPNLSEVRTSRAMLLGSVDHDLALAHREFMTALDLDPNNAVAHHWFGVLLLKEGEIAQARRQLETAEKLDPTSPAINRWLALADYVSRRYDSAIAYYLQTLDLKPDDSDAALLLGHAYEQAHNYAAALRTYGRFEQQCKCAAPLLMEARTLALMGKYAQARTQLARVKTAARKQDIEGIDMAVVLIALGERSAAINWLQKYTHSDHFASVWLNLDPRLDAVRRDPHFRSFFAGARRRSCTLAC